MEGIHFNVLSFHSTKGDGRATQRRQRKEAPSKGGGGRQHHQKQEGIAAEGEVSLSFLVVLPPISSLGWWTFLRFSSSSLLVEVSSVQLSGGPSSSLSVVLLSLPSLADGADWPPFFLRSCCLPPPPPPLGGAGSQKKKHQPKGLRGESTSTERRRKKAAPPNRREEQSNTTRKDLPTTGQFSEKQNRKKSIGSQCKLSSRDCWARVVCVVNVFCCFCRCIVVHGGYTWGYKMQHGC